jgi:RNA polymerase sigma-70 factor (ECF subfamily)
MDARIGSTGGGGVTSGAESDLIATIELVTLARQGDRSAAEQLFRRYRPRLEAFLYARVPLRSRRLFDTQDVVQDVCVKIFAALDRFKSHGIGSFWCFARSVARNHLIDAARRGNAVHETAIQEGSGSCPEMVAPGPSEESEGHEAAEDFDRALENLPDRVRTATLMRLELGLEWNVIAAECGFPSPDAARVAIKRALREIATEMSGHDDPH